MKEDDNLYYYNARWYDPAIGRFMQADTIVPSQQGTQAFDRYAYVNNNPLIYTDPSGHRLWEGDAGGDSNWHYDYVMNVLYSPYEREQNARVAKTVLDITLTVGSVVYEPIDWAVTASECISGDCSPWALLGLMPLIPGNVGNKADDIIDIGKHLDYIP
jgi:RHS repeat-associated protein